MKLTLWYTCDVCGADREEVKVRARAEDENVVFYVEQVVGYAVGREHSKNHPDCPAKKLTHLMFQVPDDARWIGDPLATYDNKRPPKDGYKPVEEKK